MLSVRLEFDVFSWGQKKTCLLENKLFMVLRLMCCGVNTSYGNILIIVATCLIYLYGIAKCLWDFYGCLRAWYVVMRTLWILFLIVTRNLGYWVEGLMTMLR